VVNQFHGSVTRHIDASDTHKIEKFIYTTTETDEYTKSVADKLDITIVRVLFPGWGRLNRTKKI